MGFFREIMLVRIWGAGGTADAIIIATFIPESLRVMLGSGLLVSSATPLWLACRGEEERRIWSATLTVWVLGLSTGLSILVLVFSRPLVGVIGPGLDSSHAALAESLIMIGVWTVPGLALQALLSMYHYSAGSVLFPGLGTAFYNGASMAYLLTTGFEATPKGFVLSLVAGAAMTSLVLIPGAWRTGWRLCGRISIDGLGALWGRLWPLLLAALAGQAFALLERVLASLAGEGMVMIVNLTRKLINLPGVIILSVSQVAMLKAFQANKAQDGPELWGILRSALALMTALTWPMALAVIVWAALAPPLIAPAMAPLRAAKLAEMLQYYAPALLFGGWSSVLTKYLYATGTTLAPTRIEIIGTALQIVTALGLFPFIGVYALPVGFSAGYALNCLLLTRPTPLRTRTLRVALAVTLLLLISAVAVVLAFANLETRSWPGIDCTRMLRVGGTAGWAAPVCPMALWQAMKC